MEILELIFIGIGLAMDAAAVSMTNGMVYKKLKVRAYIAMPVLFGTFQGLMPFAGYFAGGLFADIISRYAGIVIMLILVIVGGKMIWEGIHHMHENERGRKFHEVQGHLYQIVPKLTVTVLFFQAIATSIDAFAVGVGFSAMRVNIILAVLIIAVVTTIMVVAAILVGKKFGDLLGNRAEILGGIILVIIGIKAII